MMIAEPNQLRKLPDPIQPLHLPPRPQPPHITSRNHPLARHHPSPRKKKTARFLALHAPQHPLRRHRQQLRHLLHRPRHPVPLHAPSFCHQNVAFTRTLTNRAFNGLCRRVPLTSSQRSSQARCIPATFSASRRSSSAVTWEGKKITPPPFLRPPQSL